MINNSGKMRFSLVLIIFVLMAAISLFSLRAEAAELPSPPPISRSAELITTPTARIMGTRGRVGAEYRENRSRIYGVFRLENVFEVGGQVQDRPGDDGELGLLLKGRILTEGETRPALTAGIRGTSPYFAASKYLGRNTSVHFGIGDSQPDGLFLAVNTVFNPEVEGVVYAREADDTGIPRTNVMLEVLEDEANFGVRTTLAPELSAELSILDMENIKAGMNFSF